MHGSDPLLPPAIVVDSVIAQYAEEAAFLWTQRAAAVHAPHFGLRDLARLDERVEAHIDGLRVAGDAGWEHCRDALRNEGPGEVFAASVLAFESGPSERSGAVLAMAPSSLALSNAVVSALGWMPAATAQPHIDELIESSDPVLRRIGAAAARRFHAAKLANLLDDSDPPVRARACRGIGELGLKGLADSVWTHLKDPDECCRFWAAWSTGLLEGDREALDVLRNTAAPATQADAICILPRRLDAASGRAWVENMAADSRRVRWATRAAGALGDPYFVDWLIDRMRDPRLARVAAEAFTTITGAGLLDERLAAEEPEGFEPIPNDDPADDNVNMDPDDRLPWPSVPEIERWWLTHRGEFSSGVRYLVGRPIATAWVEHVLRTGRQRQRAAAALERAIRVPGEPLFNVAAPGFRQQRLLGIAQ